MILDASGMLLGCLWDAVENSVPREGGEGYVCGFVGMFVLMRLNGAMGLRIGLGIVWDMGYVGGGLSMARGVSYIFTYLERAVLFWFFF